MKNFFSNKIVIAICFFVLGASVDLSFNYYRNKNKEPELEAIDLQNYKTFALFDNLFNDDFFVQSKNPFSEMRRIKKQLLKRFESEPQYLSSFDNWYQSRFGGDINEMEQKEDKHFVYYDLHLPDMSTKNIKIELKGQQILLSAEDKGQKQEREISSSYKVSFFRSLPVPIGVDTQKYQIEQRNNKIRIKFPKLNIQTY